MNKLLNIDRTINNKIGNNCMNTAAPLCCDYMKQKNIRIDD